MVLLNPLLEHKSAHHNNAHDAGTCFLATEIIRPPASSRPISGHGFWKRPIPRSNLVHTNQIDPPAPEDEEGVEKKMKKKKDGDQKAKPKRCSNRNEKTITHQQQQQQRHLSSLQLGHIAALVTGGTAAAGVRDTRNERSVTVITSHSPDGGSDDNSNRNNSSDDDDHGIADECEGNGHGGVPVASSAKSMDSMNNVVTTTTTVTAIASTVHQLIPAAPATAPPPPTTTAAAASIGGKVAAPPAFSRLPPDGHEFPPNFSEPSATSTTPTGNGQAAVAAMTIMNPGSLPAPVLAKSNDKHSSFNDDLPDLPKSHPPPIPRKVLRQDLHTPPKTTNGPEPATNGDGVRKPPPFPARSSSIAESMLSRKELPPAYQTQQSSYEPPAAYRRRSVDVPEHPPTKPPTGTTGRVTLLGSNWRKDEKSERSVRDKIAMFSSESSGHAVPAPSTMTRKFGSKDFTKSSENLLSRDGGGQTTKRSTVDPIETYATLRKKAHSVENLDEVDKALPAPRLLASDSTPKFSLETSKPVVLGKAYSVENLNPQIRSTDITKSGGSGGVSLAADANKVLARTISFSGSYSNGSSLASVNQNSPAGAGDERWKSSISNLLEQRKKSMSKLRGLIIPEKVPEAEVLADSRIIGLPIIKSKDSEIILSGGLPKVEPVLPAAANSPALSYSRRTSTLPTPAKSSLNALAQTKTVETILTPTPYKPRSHSLVSPSESKQSGSESESGSGFFRKPLPPMPPAKPPRTSLVYPPPKGGSIDSGLRSTEDESGDDDEDSDSVLSSRISSPPVSPAAPVEKYTLTRTLSSETNTSITSSNSSTLTTSSAGSQASCSSVGSTPPTVDLSRKLSKSSTSSEATMNRKNVLASAKCRSGRGGELIKIGSGADGEPGLKATKGRYEDGDSTDGYEEEERRKVSKSKPRNSTTMNTGAAETTDLKRKELTHYKLVDGSNAGGDSIVDKVIKVAAYVEVVSDLEDASSELIEEEIVTSIKESPVTVLATPTPEQKKTRSASVVSGGGGDTMSDLAKWVRHEAARTISSHKDTEPKHLNAGVGRLVERKVVPRPEPVSAPVPVPVKRELRSSVETKKLNLAEIRKSFESKSANSTVIPAPVKMAAVVMKETTVNAVVPSTPTSIATVAQSSPKSHATTGPANGHDRFSSWDSLASSSSGVSSLQTNSLGLGATAPNCSGSSQTLQSTPSDYGSFSSLGSSHSLITPQDLQLIIEEADPPLATPDAFVVVLQRETPESSIGITLAGGSDYEAKEITIHKILTNSPAEKDGRLRKGDRILSINGLSMRGLTHRESLSVLKTPRPEVVMVITRSKSLVVTDTLAKLKRPSMGSLSSLAEKSELGSDYERKIKAQHKASRSLDLDHLDVASNEAESVFDGTASEDGLLSADDVSKCSSSTNATDNVVPVVADIVDGCRIVDVSKDGAGLGFSIEGGYDSPAGNKPLVIKKIFMGGAAEKSGLLRAGEEIVAINEVSIAKMTRIQVWNMMKKLPNGTVRLTLK
ncbi:PDZ domain-containing protein BBG-LP10 [Anopheles darlingi]|uniref:PDZ domain-containing protein BBG-LP10 n=1 Tax=Anopheles darlingi TaxID=43151 RepID=W5JG91_ANODA|nr:PDZ domain-containing protein BBG-LP10 [Anopheles darlingi]